MADCIRLRLGSIAAMALLALMSPATPAQGVRVPNGLVEGRDYRTWPRIERTRYVMGAVDAYLASPIIGAPHRNASVLQTCLMDMSDTQMTAIVDKYLADHPEVWHYGMHIVVINSVRAVCSELDERLKRVTATSAEG